MGWGISAGRVASRHPGLIVATFCGDLTDDDDAVLSRIAPVLTAPPGHPQRGAPWREDLRLLAGFGIPDDHDDLASTRGGFELIGLDLFVLPDHSAETRGLCGLSVVRPLAAGRGRRLPDRARPSARIALLAAPALGAGAFAGACLGLSGSPSSRSRAIRWPPPTGSASPKARASAPSR